MKPAKINNFVAKHAQKSGAGAHIAKQGKHVPRNRAKRTWQKEVDFHTKGIYFV